MYKNEFITTLTTKNLPKIFPGEETTIFHKGFFAQTPKGWLIHYPWNMFAANVVQREFTINRIQIYLQTRDIPVPHVFIDEFVGEFPVGQLIDHNRSQYDIHLDNKTPRRGIVVTDASFLHNLELNAEATGFGKRNFVTEANIDISLLKPRRGGKETF